MANRIVVQPGSFDALVDEARLLAAYPAVNVSWFGAKGDGVTDDTAAILAAYAAVPAGGVLLFPSGGNYLSRSRLAIQKSLTVLGYGATLDFEPTDISGNNYSAIGFFGGVAGPFNCSGAIAIGDSSFIAANAADAATLSPNQWVQITEDDSAVSDHVLIDWVQVSSVVGATVNVVVPFRTAFAGTHATPKFTPITTLVEKGAILGLTVQSDYVTSQGFNGIYLVDSKDVLIRDVKCDIVSGNGISTGRCKHVTVDRLWGRRKGFEFASTVDLLISNSVNWAGSTISYGSAFFAVVGNAFHNDSGNGMLVQIGPHDGAIIGNLITVGGTNGTGINAWGTQNVAFVGNSLLNLGSGATSQGIYTHKCIQGNASGVPGPWVADIASKDNVLGPNSIKNFSIEYTDSQALTRLGFYGVASVLRQTLATGAGHTVDDVITALQSLGLVKQA